jgi:fatty-acyl-CoA synthase
MGFKTGTTAERQGVLAQKYSPWEPSTLHDVLSRAAGEFAQRPFVITDTKIWTYGEMDAWSRRIAAGLRQYDIGPGDKVAIVMANYPEFVALKYAVSRIGAVAVPINILNRARELHYLLRQSEASMLVTMAGFRDLDYLQMLDDIAPDWESHGGGVSLPDLRNVVVFPGEAQFVRDGTAAFANLDIDAGCLADAVVDPGDLCDILYTSGTTGDPKGVELTHDMMTRTAFASAYARAFEDGHRILFALPMFHVFGYVEGLLSVPYVGGAIVPHLKFDAAAMLGAIECHRATDALLIPAMTLDMLRVAHHGEYDLSSLHFVLASGGNAPTRIWQEIYDMFGVAEITTGYGMTETTASTTVTRPDDPIERLLNTNGRMRDAGPAGDPAIKGRLVDYKVIDPATGVELPLDNTGELVAKGPGVTRGYYKKPEATEATFTTDGWLKTGDLGRLDGDGYIKLLGRTKESYRCGGEQVLPSEIETLLTSHPSVLQAHVVPLPDERMGEVGVAFVVARTGHTVDIGALDALCRANLARFKVPRHYLAAAAGDIPLTASGRPRKFMLSEIAKKELQLK